MQNIFFDYTIIFQVINAMLKPIGNISRNQKKQNKFCVAKCFFLNVDNIQVSGIYSDKVHFFANMAT